jgi:NAD(P)H-dependent FMN reductase
LPPSAAIDLEDEDDYPDQAESWRQKVRQADKS